MSAATKIRMHETRNDTKGNAKKVAIEALQARLTDGIDLSLDIKQAHWNLKGPQFIGIHLMLDGFRGEWTISTTRSRSASRNLGVPRAGQHRQ